MKPSFSKFTTSLPTPRFQTAIHKPGGISNTTPITQKRDNTFSKSRDLREDRGTRQMKTKHNAKAFPHVR
jgi:hypothetical protein